MVLITEKVSVIVPIFNVEEYLPSCIDSIVNQSYSNIEIILIDDGSTDKSGKIAKAYSLKDKRIRLFHKKNGGLSDARNFGLKESTEQYICFIDSDDIVEKTMIEDLLQISKQTKADIVECDYKNFMNESEIYSSEKEQQDYKIYFTPESGLKALMINEIKQVVWNKLYTKKTIDDLMFEIGRINEDEFWTYKVIGNANKVVHLNKTLYHYRTRETSIMGKQYSLKRLDAIAALEERILYMNEKYPTLENVAKKKFIFLIIYHYQKIYLNQIDAKQEVNMLFKKLKKHINFDLFLYLNIKEKIWVLMFISFPKLAAQIRNVLKKGI